MSNTTRLRATVRRVRSGSVSATEFLRRNELRLAGIVGIVGTTVGVLADLASGYSLQGAGEVTTAFSVLRLSNLSPFLLSKPPAQVVLGHYLAILGIPLGIFGLWQVYRAIEPAGWALSRAAWFLGVFAYVAGTVFHSTYAFVTFGLQAAASAPPAAAPAMQTMLDRFALAFEPLALLLVGVLAVALALIFVAIASGETRYPRWFAVANPLVIQAATGLLALFAPLEVGVFLVVTAFNFSLLVFYAASTAVLWNVRLPSATSTRNDAA